MAVRGGLCSLPLATSLAALLAMLPLSAIADTPRCSAQAADQARKLLAFHMGKGFEDRISVEAPVPLKPMRNPANRQQMLTVLQLDAHVSPRGRYRIRLIYYPLPDECVLMGQELLEMASL
jgi:hypothetical protein